MKLILIILAAMLCFTGCTRRCDVEWKFKTGGTMENSPVIADNKLIMGVSDHYLYAFDLKDGKVLWKKDLGGRVFMTPLAEGKNIYAGSLEDGLHKIRAEDGTTEWKFKNKGLEFDPCADSDGIYFGSLDGNFYKIDRQGKLLWSFPTRNKLTSSCTFYQDLVITTSWDKNVYGIRRDTGTEVWRLPTRQFNYGNGVIAGDSIYYGTHNKIYRLEPLTGKVLFEKEAAYNSHMVPWQNFIFTQENGLTKRALDGQVIQNVRFIAQTQFRPSIVGDSIVMSDTTNHLYGISPKLEIQWKFRAKDNFWAPGILHEGIYYIGNRDHYVYALRLPS